MVLILCDKIEETPLHKLRSVEFDVLSRDIICEQGGTKLLFRIGNLNDAKSAD